MLVGVTVASWLTQTFFLCNSGYSGAKSFQGPSVEVQRNLALVINPAPLYKLWAPLWPLMQNNLKSGPVSSGASMLWCVIVEQVVWSGVCHVLLLQRKRRCPAAASHEPRCCVSREASLQQHGSSSLTAPLLRRACPRRVRLLTHAPADPGDPRAGSRSPRSSRSSPQHVVVLWSSCGTKSAMRETGGAPLARR